MNQAEASAFTAGFSPCGHASCMDEHGHWDKSSLYGDLLSRITDKFTIGDGCWEWTGRRTAQGYGVLDLYDSALSRARPQGAHRLLYELLVGPIPEGLDLDHLCRNTSCVRPAHLEPVTRAENARRLYLAGVGAARANEAKTHCPQGHLYDQANTYVKPSEGRRRCRTCRSEQQRRERERRASR